MSIFPTDFPEQPYLIYLEIDNEGNIVDWLRGNYCVPSKSFNVFIATYDESLMAENLTTDDINLSFDNSGLITKVNLSIKSV